MYIFYKGPSTEENKQKDFGKKNLKNLFKKKIGLHKIGKIFWPIVKIQYEMLIMANLFQGL